MYIQWHAEEQGSPVTVAGAAPDGASRTRFRVPFSSHFWEPVASAPLKRIGAQDKMATTTLFVGGARSGKSRLAQSACEALPGPWTYIATAQAWDDEMADRIARHRADRGEGWQTVECPVALPQAIRRADGPVLVDCLTLWLTNVMLGGHDVARHGDDLIAAIRAARHPLMLVSNEVGLGIVPEHPLGRAFRDEAGRLNQAAAAAVDRCWFVVAGMVLPLERFDPS